MPAVQAIVARHRHLRGPLLPILHAVHREYGYVDPGVIPVLAKELNLSRAEVHGVVSFYRDFRTEPPGATTVRVCRAEACQAVGADAVAAAARRLFGVAPGDTSADGAVTLEDVYCLGNCALGPSVMIGDRLLGRVETSSLVVSEPAGPVGWDPSPQMSSDASTAPAITVYVPRDSAARSVGADAVADAVVSGARERGQEVRLVRTGSRGMLWLEPLVEVATPAGRVAYGPVTAADVPGLLDAGLLDAGLVDGAPGHPRHLGRTDAIGWLAGQQRLVFGRVGVVDPLSVADHQGAGGFAGLDRALAMSPADIVAEVTASGLRGRGGAGFPVGIKWKTVLEAPGEPKFLCCNADEGDSGTFADRMLIEGDPFLLIEGMVIAARAVGAREGFVYLRSEYPDAVATMRAAIEVAYAQGWLGEHILGSDTSFDLDVREGAGAYICGEETAMLESLEGKRGQVRAKPPLPALAGLFGRPTAINNVLSLASVPWILAHGAAAYHALGVGRSRGTQVFQLAGNVRRGGIVETAFGLTLRELVEDYGGGTRSGRPVRAVQVGGPLGAYLPAESLDLPMDYEAFAAADAMLGHGGVVVFDDTVDMARQARFAMEFCAVESCGKCTPCRVGAVRGVEVIDRIVAGERRDANLELLEDLCEVMTEGSLCAMGGLTPLPVRSALRNFGEDFESPAGQPVGTTGRAT